MAAYELDLGRDQDWRLQLNIDNILDRKYFEGGNSYGFPRWGEITVTASF